MKLDLDILGYSKEDVSGMKLTEASKIIQNKRKKIYRTINVRIQLNK